MRHRKKKTKQQKKKTIILLKIKIIFLLYGICVNIFIMNRCISKSYTTVSTITSYIEVRYIEVHRLLFQYIVYSRGLRAESKVCSEHMNDWQWTICTKEVT